MDAVSTPQDHMADAAEIALLRDVIERHAAIDRPAGSTGEYKSAQLLRDRLVEAGATNARIEPATFFQGWPSALALAVSIPMLAGAIGPRRGRKLLAAASIVAGVAVADDIDNRTRFLRRLLRRERPTTNVVAELGPADAPATLIVLAHHDAGRTGVMFDQSAQIAVWKRWPQRVESVDTSLPFWWPAFLAPIAVGAGLLLGSRKLQRVGAGVSAVAFGLLADIARSPNVPGANDNLSGVAVLVALAERLRERPIDGVRVVLVSAGAEEELQGGVYDYLRDHAAELDPASTFCVAVDTVGSPHLVMLEGEGTVAMEDYTDPSFRDLIAEEAAAGGVELMRGLRSRFSTDGVVTSRAGIPTVSLVSVEPWRAPSNYHLMTDVPENLTYETIAATTELTERVARRLAADAAA